MVDVYQILRKVDYLRTAIDNLQREFIMLINATCDNCELALIAEKNICEEWECLFLEQCNRIDGIAQTINLYKKKARSFTKELNK